MLSACVCAGCQELKGLKCNPSYRKPVACHRFICAECIRKAVEGERKDVTTQGAACGLSNNLCLGSPCPPLPGGGGDDTEQTWGTLCGLSVPPEKSIHPFPPKRGYVLIMCIGRQICPPSQKEMLYFFKAICSTDILVKIPWNKILVYGI